MRILLIAMVATLVAPALGHGPVVAKAKPDDPDRMICHREEVTGSLAGGRKTCHTRAEWEAQARASQATAERLIDQGRVTSCGATTLGGC